MRRLNGIAVGFSLTGSAVKRSGSFGEFSGASKEKIQEIGTVGRYRGCRVHHD